MNQYEPNRFTVDLIYLQPYLELHLLNLLNKKCYIHFFLIAEMFSCAMSFLLQNTSTSPKKKYVPNLHD